MATPSKNPNDIKWTKTMDYDSKEKFLLRLFPTPDVHSRQQTSSIQVSRSTGVTQITLFKRLDYISDVSNERKQVMFIIDQVLGHRTPKIVSVEIKRFYPSYALTKYECFVRLPDLTDQSLSIAEDIYRLINDNVHADMDPDQYLDLLRRNKETITPNVQKFCDNVLTNAPI